jgi:hypothetical protein
LLTVATIVTAVYLTAMPARASHVAGACKLGHSAPQPCAGQR